eukprot:m.103709 g.103709  ORF g.103709 m.103709 type:complete len:1497 (+) comp9100_c0_seq1:58-4548(+)
MLQAQGKEKFLGRKGKSRWGSVIQNVKDRISQKDRESCRTNLGGDFFKNFHDISKKSGSALKADVLNRALPIQYGSRMNFEQSDDGNSDLDDVYLSLLQAIVNYREKSETSPEALVKTASDIFNIKDDAHGDMLRQATIAVPLNKLSHNVSLSDAHADFSSYTRSINHDVFVLYEIVDVKGKGKGAAHNVVRSDVALQTRRFVFDTHLSWGDTLQCAIPAPKETAIQIELWKHDPFMDSYFDSTLPSFRTLSASTMNLASPSDFFDEHSEMGDLNSTFDSDDAEDEDDVANELDSTLADIMEKSRKKISRPNKNKTKTKKKKKLFRKLRKAASKTVNSLRTATPTASIASERITEDTQLIGRGILPLAGVAEESKEYHVKLYKNGKNTNINFSLHSSLENANLGSTLRSARNTHKQLLRTVFFRAVKAHRRRFGTKSGRHDPWDCILSEETHEILRLHGNWIGINSSLQRLDFLHTLMQLHGEYPVSMFAIKQALDGLHPQQSWDTVDENNFLSCLQAIYSYSFPSASSPFQAEGATDDGFRELRAHVDSLLHVFNSKLWQRAVANGGVQPPNENDQEPVVQHVRECIASQEYVTFLTIQRSCEELFGKEQFERHRGKIQRLLHEKVEIEKEMKSLCGDECQSSRPATSIPANNLEQGSVSMTVEGTQTQAPMNAFSERHQLQELSSSLPEMLRGCRCSQLTNNSIQEKLQNKFDKKVVVRARRIISKAILSEIQNRKDKAHDSVQQEVTLAAELQREVEIRAIERYFAVKFMSSMLEKTNDNSDIVRLYSLIELLTQDIETCITLRPAYKNLPEFDIVEIVARTYEEKIAEDIDLLLRRRGNDDYSTCSVQIPVELFELYFSTQTFWETVCNATKAEVLETLKLNSYWKQFEPFVRDWLVQSAANAEAMITRAVHHDSFQPVDKDTQQLFSSSVYDCYTILFDILDFWDKIDWPDVEVAEDVLFVALSSSICRVIRHYTDVLIDEVTSRHRNDDQQRKNSLSYTVPQYIYACLNNLSYALEKLVEIMEVMKVNEIEEEHNKKALNHNKNHTGKIKSHASVRRFASTKKRIVIAIKNISQIVAISLCARVKNDVVVIADGYQRAKDQAGHIKKKLTGLLGFDHHMDDGDDDVCECDEDRCLNARQEKMSKRTKAILESIDTHVMDKDTAYLYNAFESIMCNIQEADVIDVLLARVWQETMILLRTVFLKEVATTLQDPRMLARFVFDLRANFKHFFVGDGQGLTPDTMNKISDKEFDPVLNMEKLRSSALVTGFFRVCSELQSDRIEHLIRGSESNIVVALEPRENVGAIRLSMQYFPDEDRANIRILSAQALPSVSKIYLVIRFLSLFGENENKEETKHRGSGPVVEFNHEYNIQNLKRCQQAALQIRVQYKTKLSRQAIVIGEVLISPQRLHSLRHYLVSGVRVTLPLFPLNYDGQPGWYQQYILTHPNVKDDQQLKDFCNKYHKRFRPTSKSTSSSSKLSLSLSSSQSLSTSI